MAAHVAKIQPAPRSTRQGMSQQFVVGNNVEKVDTNKTYGMVWGLISLANNRMAEYGR
jgi:hypothetical protein